MNWLILLGVVRNKASDYSMGKEKKENKMNNHISEHWYENIETKTVVCLCCGEKFKTRLAPYWTEYKFCIDCVENNSLSLKVILRAKPLSIKGLGG